MRQKIDRRIRRTNRSLTAALIELTSQRPYASIQVRDITDQADVGYATFYRHYDSKDDLMLSVFKNITEELENAALDQGSDYFEGEGILLFGHVEKYKGLYQSIIHSQEFIAKLKRFLSKRIERQIADHVHAQKKNAFPADLAAHHMVVAVIGLIEWWLDNGNSLTTSEMARIYKRLVVQATWIALDGSNNLSSAFDHIR